MTASDLPAFRAALIAAGLLDTGHRPGPILRVVLDKEGRLVTHWRPAHSPDEHERFDRLLQQWR